MDAQQKIALVTGAGSGIGKSSALALARAGYSVVLVGRRAEKLEEVAAAVGADGPPTLVVPTDVSSPEGVADLFQETRRVFGRVDVLFNNAGVNIPSTSIEEVSPEDWSRVVDINLTGMFLCTREAFQLMKEQSPRGGRIINNGSVSAFAPRPGSAPYTATKHAVLGLTKSTSLDGRKYDIACGQIDIGNAETEMAAGQKRGVPQANGEVVAEPTMDVELVAQAVVQMAGLPLDANILSMTIMATKMPFVGRG